MRNDIRDAISFLAKEDKTMFNKAELARRFGCDPRTVDRYLRTQSGIEEMVRQQVIDII